MKKNFRLDGFSDIISSLPLCFYFTLIYLSVIKSPPASLLYLKIFGGLMFTTLTTDFIKRLPYPNFLWEITRRPEGAKYRFSFKEWTSASRCTRFPIRSYVCYCLYSIMCSYYFVETNIGHVLNLLIVLLMAWSRWYKGVHNIFQIVGGIGYATLCSYIAIFLIGENSNWKPLI